MQAMQQNQFRQRQRQQPKLRRQQGDHRLSAVEQVLLQYERQQVDQLQQQRQEQRDQRHRFQQALLRSIREERQRYQQGQPQPQQEHRVEQNQQIQQQRQPRTDTSSRIRHLDPDRYRNAPDQLTPHQYIPNASLSMPPEQQQRQFQPKPPHQQDLPRFRQHQITGTLNYIYYFWNKQTGQTGGRDEAVGRNC